MLLKQTLLYLPAQILSPLVQFASILIWAKLLQPEDLGVVTLVIASQEVCFAACFGWWSRYTLRFINTFGPDSGRPDYLRTEMAAMLGSVILQTLIVTPVLVFGAGVPLSPNLLLLANAFMITRSLNNYQSERARADGKIALYSFIQICGPVIGFVVGLALLLHYGSSPAAVFGGFIVAQLVGLAAGISISDFGRDFGRPSLAILRKAASFGVPVMIASVLAIMALNAPRFIVGHVLGITAVGMFAVGYSLGLRASSFAVTLVTAGAYPLVVRKMEREGKEAAFEQLSKNMLLVALSVLPVAFGLLGINRSVVGLLVAPQYREVAYVVLPLATLGGLFRYLRAHTSDQVFLVCLRPGYSTVIAVVDIVVAILSTYLGLKWLGLEGAALGPMVSGLVTLSTSFFLSRMQFGFRAPLQSFLRILLAACGMYAVLWLLPIAHDPIALVLHIVIGAVVYVALLLVCMGKERRTIWAMLSQRLRRKGG